METVAFDSIGFHAALILNRLRNEQRIADDNGTDEHGRRENDQEKETKRKHLAQVEKKRAAR
jgi:hypothetical protein